MISEIAFPSIFLILLLMLGLALALPSISTALLSLEIDVSGLPLTNHAQSSHLNQEWNAVSIQAYMSSGNCQPQQYACPSDDFDVVYCQLNPDKAIGLIIGRTAAKIITGFMAPVDYWTSRCH